MEKENKIISFNNCKKRVANNQTHIKYRLEYIFKIKIFQEADNKYSFNYLYPEEITEDNFFKIIFEIYLKSARKCKSIQVTSKDLNKLLNRNFSILYYINVKNPKDFKFICTPAISDSELVILLSLVIDNY